MVSLFEIIHTQIPLVKTKDKSIRINQMDKGFDNRFIPPRYATAREERDFMNARGEYEQMRNQLISKLEENEGKPIILKTPEGRNQVEIYFHPKSEAVSISFIDDWQLLDPYKRAYKVELDPTNPEYFSGQPAIFVYSDRIGKNQGLEDMPITRFVAKDPRFGDSSETESEFAGNLGEVVRRVFA